MIVVASGHPGVDGYIASTYGAEAIRVAGRYEGAKPLLAEASAVLLGGDLPGLPDPEELYADLGAGRVVLWVAEDDAPRWRRWLRKGDLLWSGALEQRRLDEWIECMLARPPAVPRRFAVWSAAGYLDRRSLFAGFVEAAGRAYGPGVVVDLAWHDPQLTYHSELGAHLPESPEPARLWARRTRYGAFVPAPPPWEPIWARPGREDLDALERRHPGQWIGIDMGSDLRNPLWPTVVAHAEVTYLIVPETPWEDPLGEVVTLLRTINEDARLAVVGDSRNPGWWTALRWPGVEVLNAKGPSAEEGPAREGWQWPIFNRRRGMAKGGKAGRRRPKKR